VIVWGSPNSLSIALKGLLFFSHGLKCLTLQSESQRICQPGPTLGLRLIENQLKFRSVAVHVK
jgi:hypothetical protein